MEQIWLDYMDVYEEAETDHVQVHRGEEYTFLSGHYGARRGGRWPRLRLSAQPYLPQLTEI